MSDTSLKNLTLCFFEMEEFKEMQGMEVAVSF